MRYVVLVETDPGKGDHGTNRQCVMDKNMIRRDAIRVAQMFANIFRRRVELFKGKAIGRLDSVWEQT
jgi:hypothetical protein